MASYSPPSPDADDLADEVGRLFQELARRRPDRRSLVAGECTPLLDVLETPQALEIVLDVPGMSADSLLVVVRRGVVLIVGEKERSEPGLRRQASFHLVERDFGRFARAVRVEAAVDASRARARLVAGELHISLPKIADRRGQPIEIRIDGAGSSS
jgi:HSP20 family protein